MSDPLITACDRSVLRIAGPDARGFLQGLLTNDIDTLDTQASLYACLLSPQGKFLHEMIVTQESGTYLLITHTDRLNDLHQKMTQYRLRKNIKITPLSDMFVGLSLSKNMPIPDPRHPDLGGYALSASPFDKKTDLLTRWHELRIRNAIADGVNDAEIGISTLEELNIPAHHGVSFTKGCYVGQELTARIHNRGLAKKHLVPVLFDGPAPKDRPDIYAGEMLVGQLRSAHGSIGLALLKDDAHHAPLTCAHQTVTLLK